MTPPINGILVGDALKRLAELPDECVQCCITSPPYWGLRDYGVKGQLGLEKTPEEYVGKMVEVFREVRRVMRADGTLWLNMGDAYNAYNGGAGPSSSLSRGAQTDQRPRLPSGYGLRTPSLKPKDLIGIPWRLAFALQADGWWLRSDIIWAKPNPMPESVTDRPTKAHEYVFLLTKSERYFYNAEAVKEPATYDAPNSPESIKSPYGQGFTRRAKVPAGWDTKHKGNPKQGRYADRQGDSYEGVLNRNRRTVWTIPTAPFPEAHFATFPEKLVEPCILAGSREGDVVLDPFMGAGTVALVALKAARKFIGIELNPKYVKMARARIEPEISQMRLV